jgi:TonB family protein
MRFLLALLLALLGFQSGGQEPSSEACVMHVEALHYPALARQTRVAGEVKISAMVGETGNVILPSASSGHPLLSEAALTNIRKWKFQPTPHSFTIEVTYEFVLMGPDEVSPNEQVSFDLPHHVLIVASPSQTETERSR